MLKETGQNPEANVNVEVEYPYIDWLSKPFLAAAVANSDGAARIATNETDIQRQADSMFSYNFMVNSQSGSKPHLVRLSKKCVNPLEVCLRIIITCGCQGWKALAGTGRVYQHCGGVLLKCMLKHRAAPRMLTENVRQLALGYPASAPPPMLSSGGRVAKVMSNILVHDKCRFCCVDTPDHPGRLCPMNPMSITNRRLAPNAANVE